MGTDNSGFSFVELSIALVLTAFVSLGAYRAVHSVGRTANSSSKETSKLLSLRTVEVKLAGDLRRVLSVRSILPCATSSSFCSSVIVSGITPLHGKNVDGNSANSDAVRIVVPVEGVDPIQLTSDLTDVHDDVEADASAEPHFPRYGFAMIDDGYTSDVFYITQAQTTGSLLRLSHEDSLGGTSIFWNHPDGLSKEYMSDATLRPVEVITIGLRQQLGQDFLVRKKEGGQESVLGTGVRSLEIFHHAFGLPSQGSVDPSRALWSEIRRVSLHFSISGTAASDRSEKLTVAMRNY